MKKVGLFVLGFVFMLALSGFVVGETCEDSDGGLYPYIKGSTLFQDGEYNDKCVIPTNVSDGGYAEIDDVWYDYIQFDNDYCEGDDCYIAESYCTPGDNQDFSVNLCPYGCSNGACISRGDAFPGDVYEITITGKLVDRITGKPVVGAHLFSAYEFSPEEVVTNSDGSFKFAISTDFVITESIEMGMKDRWGQWSFYHDCYGYTQISSARDYEGHILDLGLHTFDKAVVRREIDGETYIDVGTLEAYPNADLSINSDIEASFEIQYQLKSENYYGGTGNSNYRTEHYSSSGLPLGYDTFVKFEDEDGNVYESSIYSTPMDVGCSAVVSLDYFNGESDWSIAIEIEESPVPSEPDTMSVDISKGWNLIYGFVEPDQIMNGDIPENDIRAIYALMPNLQEYARVWPDPEWDKLGTLDDDEILNMGMWVYSDRSGYITYRLYTEVIPFYKRQIYDGWNFVGITEGMIGIPLTELYGNCDILRAYEFNIYEQDWMPAKGLFTDLDVGYTWVINVDDNCMLGETPSIIPAPPLLPEVGGDLDTDEPLEIEGYILTDVRSEEDCDEFNEGGVSGEVCMVMTNLRYENSEIGDSAYITLIDYTKGFEIFKKIIGQYFSGVSSEYEYAYNLEGDNAIVWFSYGPYDIVVSERGQGIAANHVTNYFYNKYPAYDAGVEIVERCRDSDGGLDYYTKGTASYGDLIIDDLCEGAQLTEFVCDPDFNEIIDYQFDCPNGCSDGACIIPNGAYDSDGGVNYEERGTCVDDIRGYVRTHTDDCGAWYDDVYNPNVLTEFRTGGGNEGCWHDEYECPGLCVEGACVDDVYNVDAINDKIKSEIDGLFVDDKRIVVYLGWRMATIKAGGSYGVAFGIKNIVQGTAETGRFRYEVTVNDDVQQKCDLSEREVEAWIAAGMADTLAIAPGESSIGLIRFVVPENTQGCNARFYIDVTLDNIPYARDVFDINIV